MGTDAGMAHDAFISYSHAGDAELAAALEQGLERLARPWYRLRAISVFRDQSDLALTPHLWSTIAATLAESRFLIVLASPESAASPWVNKEVAHWCETRGTEQLLVVVTGGEIGWDDETGDFAADSTAVPPALRDRFAEEPLYHDLRWARGAPELS
ncbi:MAG TPA: toll/interleukin-1 receptor domain-containing protein, partial [Acidimicrobiales bacterium]